MVRRAGLMAAGLVMATSFGLAGAGAASAAAPALKIKPGATWTIKGGPGVGCLEEDVFQSNGTFTGYSGDAGTWSGGGETISMSWTAGTYAGVTFDGAFTKTPTTEYRGSFGGPLQGFSGHLIKGVHGC